VFLDKQKQGKKGTRQVDLQQKKQMEKERKKSDDATEDPILCNNNCLRLPSKTRWRERRHSIPHSPFTVLSSSRKTAAKADP
jgi:hypothetical protein